MVAIAVPGFLGHAVLRTVIEAGTAVVDISFSPEDPMVLHDFASEKGVRAIVDCGVAPGLSNVLVGFSAAEFERLDDVLILVGGLPRKRVWPWEYRAVFSPTDVLEEYVRPCRVRLDGREVVRPALSEVELVEFPQVGTLEAFLTDGLRTLLQTIPARTLREKTLRYPGHAERMRLLREAGFLDASPIQVGDGMVSPRNLTERLLFPSWKLGSGEEEFTILRVSLVGERGRERRRIEWDLFDVTDPATGFTSMARTTGFPCAALVRMLADGSWSRPGVHPPERLGGDRALVDRLLSELQARGVRLTRREETL